MEKVMPQYIARRGRYNYEIAKFDDTDSPLDIYHFTQRGCSCPAYVRSCKHNRILSKWKRTGEKNGEVYNDQAQLLGNIFTFHKYSYSCKTTR